MSNTSFTYIMDWKGGTYVSQISGDDIEATKKEWVEHIVHVLPEIQKEGLKKLMREVNDETPVLLDALTNVWAISPEFEGEIATVNIIKTAI